MSSNNQNNSNRREKDNKNFNNQKDSTPITYEPEFMDAEDSLLEVRSSLGKAEKNGNLAEKLVDTVFFLIFKNLN